MEGRKAATILSSHPHPNAKMDRSKEKDSLVTVDETVRLDVVPQKQLAFAKGIHFASEVFLTRPPMDYLMLSFQH